MNRAPSCGRGCCCCCCCCCCCWPGICCSCSSCCCCCCCCSNSSCWNRSCCCRWRSCCCRWRSRSAARSSFRAKLNTSSAQNGHADSCSHRTLESGRCHAEFVDQPSSLQLIYYNILQSTIIKYIYILKYTILQSLCAIHLHLQLDSSLCFLPQP